MLFLQNKTMMFIYHVKKCIGITRDFIERLKPIDYKLLFELMKDSHRSDDNLPKL